MNRRVDAFVETFGYFETRKGCLSSFKWSRDEEILEKLLLYMFNEKELKIALQRLEEVPFVSELMNPDAMFMVFGGISKRADSFMKAIKSAYNAIERTKRIEITNKERFEKLLIEKFGNALVESVSVLFLNSRNEIEHISSFTTNDPNSTRVDYEGIVSDFKKFSAESVVVVHNHPSGVLRLSNRDFLFMLSLEGGLMLFDIPLKANYLVSSTECKRYESMRHC